MKKPLLIILLNLGLAALVWAGDVANFVNLGFSEDSRYFMFGQYGISEEASLPYAELFTVDVLRNEYAPQGVRRASYGVAVQPGQNGHGALLTALHDFSLTGDDPVGRFRINHLKTGRLVYLLVNGGSPQDQIEFRDFGSGNSYSVGLTQSRTGTGPQSAASFYLTVGITGRNGPAAPRIVGLPNLSRPGVESYRIKEAIFSPDESALIFVIEMNLYSPRGSNIRYMVETVPLR
ncbi:MAG: DUF2259 domain-containing protein [Spirochaetales bacterium]|jgi:predicted secreted protein|nr:DUF2259 domain-containing protein [Spirochaetales bacterium]